MSTLAVLKPTYWKERALDAYWLWAAPSTPDPVTLTWPVPREVVDEMTVHWPDSYPWAPMHRWGDQIEAALARFVTVKSRPIAQPHDGVISFHLELRGRTFRINVETSDYLDLNEQAYAEADLHFKMQYRLEGYGARDRLLPGGYLNNLDTIYRFLPRLRSLRDTSPALHDVHGRFGLCLNERRTALDVLTQSRAFSFVGGERKVRYGSFLREVALSRVCIDLPSYSPLTFRLMDYFAIGSCVIGPMHQSQLQIPFTDRVHLAYCRSDYSDLEALCVHYLNLPEERQSLVDNSRRFFDAYIHRDQLATYYLSHLAKAFA
jgi:hypothetical protein